MRHPWSLLPALLAVAATTMPTVAAADPALGLSGQDAPGPASRSAAATVRQAARTAPREDESALGVTIDALSPSYLPAQGPVRVNGTLTNNTDERWVAINLHLFIGDTPITSTQELAEATDLDPAEPVGDRITAPGTFDTVASLRPGASAQFSIKVSRSALGVTRSRGLLVRRPRARGVERAARRHRGRPGPHLPAAGATAAVARSTPRW